MIVIMMKNKGYLQQNQHGQMLNDDEFHLSVAKRTGFGCNGDHIPVSEHEPTAVGKRQQEREGKEVHRRARCLERLIRYMICLLAQ